MIHNPQKVVTDLTVKLYDANMAKAATNMRFGSYNGIDAFGIATIGGTDLVPNELIGTGLNACVGAKEINDKSGIIWANWNDDIDEQCFFFLEYATGLITRIDVPNLNFKQDHYPDEPNYLEDYNVSINEINDILFWNDGPNQPPKKINWKRTYTSDLSQPWEVARITRQPAYPLRMDYASSGATTPVNLSTNAFDNTSVPPVGYQWGFTYTRDDDEESRGGPISQVVWSQDLNIYVPDSEYDYLLVGGTTPNNLSTRVNFYFRVGNNGPWLFYDYLDNILDNYVDESGTLRMKIEIPDMRFIQGTASIGDPFAQTFDAVPLYVRDSIIAINRLFDTNFTEDYNPSNAIDIDVDILPINSATLSSTPERRVLHPNDVYQVGVSLLDFAGRRVGVENITQFQSPNPDYHRYGDALLFPDWATNTALNTYFTLGDLGATYFEAYIAQLNISGSVPSWCEHIQVSISKSKSTSTFFRTVGFAWLWAQKDNEDYVAFAKIQSTGPPAVYVNPSGGSSYKGIAIELGSGEPFVFDVNENQYVRFIGTAYETNIFSPDPLSPISINYEDCDEWRVSDTPFAYKITKQIGSRIFIELNSAQIEQFKKGFWFTESIIPEDGMASLNKAYVLDIFSIPAQTQDAFYQVYNTILTPAQVTSGTSIDFYGDCYLKNANKSFNVGTVYNLISENGVVIDQNDFNYPSFDWIQFQICESLQSVWPQSWDSDIGQANFKNINQKQTTQIHAIQWSNQYLPGTQINGLSSVNPLNRREMPLELGFVNCLRIAISTQSTTTVLLAYCQNGVQTNYLSVAQTVDSSGSVVWSTTLNVIGQSNTLSGPYGSNRAKQVASTNNNQVFHYCPEYEDLIQYALDGLNRLGQQQLFQNAMNEVENKGRICIGFDPRTQEVVGSGDSALGFAYNFLYKAFQGKRNYDQTDRFCFVQNTLYSWKDGELYLHDPENQNRAFIYGERFPSTFDIITAPQPNKMKQWESIEVAGYLFGLIQLNGLPSGQGGAKQTYLEPDNFKLRKDIWKAAILRDENSTGGRWNGDWVESTILETIFTEVGETVKTINFVTINGVISIAQ